MCLSLFHSFFYTLSLYFRDYFPVTIHGIFLQCEEDHQIVWPCRSADGNSQRVHRPYMSPTTSRFVVPLPSTYNNRLFKSYVRIRYIKNTCFSRSREELQSSWTICQRTPTISEDGPARLSTSPVRAQMPVVRLYGCLLYTSPSPRDRHRSRMPSSA